MRSSAYRKGFTLIELLLVIGIIAILAAIVIVAVNPSKQLGSVYNAKRRSESREMQNALYQYLIDHGRYPSASSLAEGEANARPICRRGVEAGTSSCVSMDALVADYLVDIPLDSSETDEALSGYSIYLSVGRAIVLPEYLDTEESSSAVAVSSAASSSVASSVIPGSVPSSAPPSSVASSSVASSSSTIAGLVAYWKFDDASGTTAVDSSGNGYAGTLTNGPAWSGNVAPTTFANTRALSFDGTNDYVATADIDVPTFTVSAWVMANAGTQGYVLTKGYNGFSIPYFLNVGGTGYPNQLDGVGFLPGYAYFNSGPVTPDIRGDGQYHHIAGTYDGVRLRYYVDGVLKSSSADGSWIIPQNDGIMDIGTLRSENKHFSGLIDDVRIYNRALTGAEMAILAGGGM